MAEFCLANAERYPSVLHHVHAAVHQLRAQSSTVLLASAIDSWTCFVDTDVSLRHLELNQVRRHCMTPVCLDVFGLLLRCIVAAFVLRWCWNAVPRKLRMQFMWGAVWHRDSTRLINALGKNGT